LPGQTPFQTVGPFFHDGLAWEGGEDLLRPETLGERIRIEGCVRDGDGKPVPDALIEIWQANAAGRYNHPEDRQEKPLDPAFIGFGRSATRADGSFRFATIRPGRVPGRGNTLQAPHIALSFFCRGLLRRLVTRIYFEDSPENGEDPVLALIPDPMRRATLLARRTNGVDGLAYRFDIRLQGEGETVFFDC
jgi:protocatechuate 3,4-dioxygenase, alpha subunit